MNDDDRFRAGTLVHFDFSELGGAWPEMTGKHPAIVISPRKMQKHGTLILVPVSSSRSRNANNPDAVRLTTDSVIQAHRAGQSYAICNLAIAVSLQRASLDLYTTKRDRERGNRHHLNARDLRAIRVAVLRNILSPDFEFPAARAALEQGKPQSAPPSSVKATGPTIETLVALSPDQTERDTPRNSDVLKRLSARIVERRLIGNRPRQQVPEKDTGRPQRAYLAASHSGRTRHTPTTMVLPTASDTRH